MAELAVRVATAGAGFLVGGPWGARAGWVIGGIAAGAFFGEDIESSGPRIEDGKITSSAYGQPIPKIYGTGSLPGNVIDASTVRENETSRTVGGKDFGGPSQVVTSYNYEADLAILLSEGEIDDVLQIYVNETLKYDATSGSTVVSPDWLAFTLYKGTEDQDPDPTFEAIHGVGEVPAYRGRAYIVFKSFQFSQGSLSANFRFVLAKSVSNSIVETDITLPDDVSSSLYSPRSQIVALPITYASAQTGGEDVEVLLGIDPYSRAVVWQTTITDADDFYTRGGAVLCVNPSYIGIPFAEETAICVLEKGFPDTDGHAVFYDAVTGQLILRVEVVDYASSSSIAFPDPLQLTAVQHTSTVAPVVSVSLLDYSILSDTYTTSSISAPSGYDWASPGTILSSNNDGKVLVPAETNPGGDTALVIVEVTGVTLALTATTTGVTLTADFINLSGMVWDEAVGVWWIIGMNSGTGADGPVIFSVTPGGTATEYDLENLYGIDDTDCTVSSTSGRPGLALDTLTGDLIWQGTNGTVWIWNPNSGEDPVSYAGGTNQGGVVWHRGTRTAWGVHNGTAHGLHTLGLTGQTQSLENVVEDLCDGTELTGADHDCTDLSGIGVQGAVFSRQMARRDAIQALRSAYLFDFVPRDGVLTAILRGDAPTVTLDEDDLGAHVLGSEAPQPIVITQVAESKLPIQLDLTYISANQNYEPVTQTARRLASAGGTESQINIPIVLTENEGAQLADTLLHLAHISSELYSGTAMPSQADNCAPGEIITASIDGETYTWRIEESSIVNGEIIELRGERDDDSLYSSFAVGGSPRSRSRSVLAAGATLMFPLDLPMLRNIDDDSGIYLALGSYTPGWPGCEIYQSLDGETFNYLKAHTDHAVFGVVLNETDDWTTRTWDTTTTIEVRAINSTFSGGTWDTIVSGDRIAAWGQAGRFEIVGFTTPTQQSDDTWHITGLARGLRDTIQYADDHVAGDLFIILSESDLVRIAWDTDQHNAARQLKAATVGRFLNDAIAQSVTPTSRCLEPFAPCNLHGSKSGTDWTLSWMRQDRALTAAFQQPSNSEATESYRVRIVDSLGVELNTYDVTSTSKTYDDTEQTADYGDEVDIVYFQVAQISAITGVGNWSDICAVGRIYPLVDVTDSGTVAAYISNGDYTSGWSKDQAFDDGSARWQSNDDFNGADNYIGCQWSSGRDIRNVSIQQSTASGAGRANQMVVEYSDNGTDYTTADTITLVEDDTIQAFDLPLSGSHTYWRCRATGYSNQNLRWCVREITMNEPNVL